MTLQEIIREVETLSVAERQVLAEYLTTFTDAEPRDAMGYPIGYFDRTYGSFADDPIEHGEQPPPDVRDEIE